MWIRQKYGQRRNVNVEAAAAAAATHHHNTNQVLFHVRSTFGSRRHIRHQIVVPALRKETKKNQRKENYLLRVQVKSRKMRRPEKEETHDCFLTSHLLMQWLAASDHPTNRTVQQFLLFFNFVFFSFVFPHGLPSSRIHRCTRKHSLSFGAISLILIMRYVNLRETHTHTRAKSSK